MRRSSEEKMFSTLKEKRNEEKKTFQFRYECKPPPHYEQITLLRYDTFCAVWPANRFPQMYFAILSDRGSYFFNWKLQFLNRIGKWSRVREQRKRRKQKLCVNFFSCVEYIRSLRFDYFCYFCAFTNECSFCFFLLFLFRCHFGVWSTNQFIQIYFVRMRALPVEIYFTQERN